MKKRDPRNQKFGSVLAVLDVQKLIKVLRAPSTTHPHVEGKNIVYATKVQENTAQYSSETAPPAPLRKVAVVSVSVDDVISVGVSRAQRSRQDREAGGSHTVTK